LQSSGHKTALVVCVMAFCAHAQQTDQPSAAPGTSNINPEVAQFSVHHLGGNKGPEGACGIKSITGMPFTAKRIATAPGDKGDPNNLGGKLELIVARDSRGRVRCENFGGGFTMNPKAEEVYIYDPVKGVDARYHPQWPENQRAVVLPLKVEQAALGRHPDYLLIGSTGGLWMPGRTTPNYAKYQLVGTRTLPSHRINGIPAVGFEESFQISPKPEIYSEILTIQQWVSPDYALEIRSNRKIETTPVGGALGSLAPTSGVVTVEATEFSLGEPDPTLFQVPDNFEIQTCKSMSGPGVDGWMNC
jgi:hypothetical protein